MSIDVREVVGAIDAMRDAYTALPDLRRRIDDLEAALAQKQRDFDELEAAHSGLQDTKASLEDKLKTTEVERDQYYFRSEELAEAVAKAASLFGSVAPKAEPVAEQVTVRAPQGDGEDKAQAGQSEGGPTSTITTTEPEQSATEGKSDYPLAGAPSGESSVTTGSVSELPANVGLLSSTTSSHSEGSQSDTPFASTPATSPQSGSESGQGQSYAPSRQSSVTTSTASTQEAVNIVGSHPASGISSERPKVEQSMTNKPYEGRPYYSKPQFMPWKEWRNGGGECPSWVLAEMDAA